MTEQRHDSSHQDNLRDTAAALFRAAVEAVEPTRLVARHVGRHQGVTHIGRDDTPLATWTGPTLVVGAGKAAGGMASACEDALADRVYGEVIVADGCGLQLPGVVVTEAGHPLPDERGHRAALRLLHLVDGAQDGGILCLISGGASSLMVCPRPPLTLAAKIDTTRALLECGADIREFNTVRKHLSMVKGGGLVARARLPVVTLIISDVVGDDPAVIGSGPTNADPSTFADACAVVSKYKLWRRLPPSVRRLLRDGAAGLVAETLKPTDQAAQLSKNLVIASNAIALDASATVARARGWTVMVEVQPVLGDTTEAARSFAARVREQVRARRQVCMLAGGETTVRVRGKGRGGRNQEFALAMAEELAGMPVCILSAGTDGIDGPTPAAGAFLDGTTTQRGRAHGFEPTDFLERNDSFTYFSQLGDLFTCGPTGTNVMDVKIALVSAAP